MRIRTLATVAAMALVAPLLSVSSVAQERTFVLNAAETALANDVKAECKSEIDGLYELARAEKEAPAEVDKIVDYMMGEAIKGERSSVEGLRFMEGGAKHETSVAGPFLRCVIKARLAQHAIGNRPLARTAAPSRAPASTPAPTRPSASAQLCEEMGKELQVQSRNWPQTGAARALRLGREQKALFTTGACAGTSNAPAWIAGADRMIAGAGGSTGLATRPSAPAPATGGGYTATFDHQGRVISSSGDPVRAADVRENPSNPSAGVARSVTPRMRRMTTASPGFPVPDANRCLKIIEAGPSGVCRKEDPSMAVRIANSCSEVMSMQLCVYNATARNWRCGSGTYGRHVQGGNNHDTVLRSECNTNGEYLIAFCSEASRRASNGGSCGGDPNTQGY